VFLEATRERMRPPQLPVPAEPQHEHGGFSVAEVALVYDLAEQGWVTGGVHEELKGHVITAQEPVERIKRSHE